MSTFYFEKMNSIEFAIRHAMGAILRARDSMSIFIKLETTSECDLQNSKEAMQVLQANVESWKKELIPEQ
jgi:hypothetical protein